MCAPNFLYTFGQLSCVHAVHPLTIRSNVLRHLALIHLGCPAGLPLSACQVLGLYRFFCELLDGLGIVVQVAGLVFGVIASMASEDVLKASPD